MVASLKNANYSIDYSIDLYEVHYAEPEITMKKFESNGE